MVTLHNSSYVSAGGEGSSHQSSMKMFAYVSWTLLVLASVMTAAAAAGYLVLPLALDDPDRQQQSFDMTINACAVLLLAIEIALAVGFERLSAIARKQIRFQREMASPRNANADVIEALDDLAKRTRQVALVTVLSCPYSLIFLTVVGSYIESRHAGPTFPVGALTRAARADTGRSTRCIQWQSCLPSST